MTRHRLTILATLLCFLPFSHHAARAAAGQYVESFGTLTYKDPVNTTAFWNNGTGQLTLIPFVPALVGSFNTTGFAIGVEVSGYLAFVADFDAGLRVFDITNEASPTLLGTYNSPGSALRVAVDGDLAYLADGTSGLRVVSIANPASPTQLGFVITTNAQDVAVAGDLAFVADGTAGLRIINVANPAAPSIISTFNTPGSASGVAVAGDLVFVADDTVGLRIISIVNPATPTLVGSYDTAGFALRVDVAGDMAVVADANSGVVVLDITNPSSPSLMGTYDTPGIANDIAVSGDLVFVADDASGMQVVSIANPAIPVLINTYNTPGLALGIAVSGEHAFIADEASGLEVVWVSDRSPMRQLGTLDTSDATDIQVDGDYAFVADRLDGLRVIDVSDPANPTLAGQVDTPGIALNVAVDGNLAVVGDHSGGVRMVDVTNPAAPSIVGNFPTATAYAVDIAGDLAFVACGTDGLKIINISNPASPTLVGTYNTPNDAQGVVVAGDLAFVADLNQVYFIGISNPAIPTLVGSYDNPGTCNNLAVAGDLLFVPDGGGFGLQIIGIANPGAPTFVGAVDTPGVARDVAIDGEYAFVAEQNPFSALRIINIENPAAPVQVGSFTTTGPWSVTTAGDIAYVADGAQGLRAIEVFNHEFFTRFNQGRSLTIDSTSDPIVAARLTSTQTPGVSWEISADAGTTWQPFVPDNVWTPIATEGIDLQWRSTHVTTAPTVNPAVSDMQIEWLWEYASIDAVADLPGDQGGWVRLTMTRSGRDLAAEPLPIAHYGVWRRVDSAALIEILAGVPHDQSAVDPSLAQTFEALPLFSHDGRTFVESSFEVAGTLPPGTWEFITTIPAIQQNNYLVALPTATDAEPTEFVVTAHTTTPSIWYTSTVASGQSVDNIAPGVPTGFAVAYNTGDGNTLSWNLAPEEDFQYFRVYRSTDPSFTPSLATLVHETATTGWADPDYDGGVVYYKITALDHAGNESGPAIATVTAIGDTPAPRVAALYQNHPNPFNPATHIRYDVPRGGADVQLAIYDVSGRRVRTLVSGRQSEGEKSANWDGRDDAGAAVATGVYFYRATIGSFASTRKMVLLK